MSVSRWCPNHGRYQRPLCGRPPRGGCGKLYELWGEWRGSATQRFKFKKRIMARRTPRLGAPPRFTRPCEPALVGRPPAGSDWLHEVKHDGFCVLAWKQGERVKVWSRRGADFTDLFLGIAQAVRRLSVDRALIDGEAVVRSDRQAERLRSAYDQAGRTPSNTPFTARAIRCAVDDGRARSRRTVDGRSPSSGGERSPRSDPRSWEGSLYRAGEAATG